MSIHPYILISIYSNIPRKSAQIHSNLHMVLILVLQKCMFGLAQKRFSNAIWRIFTPQCAGECGPTTPWP